MENKKPVPEVEQSEILTPKEIAELYDLQYSTVIDMLNTARAKKLLFPRKHG